jgi:exodeoxyribonuclease VII large subunit
MVKQVKSQWDFGGLFPPQSPGAERKILSVSELTAQVRRLLEQQIGSVWVTGEATNLRAQSSGHVYFTLKDATAQLNCVLFRGETISHRELLQDGQKLLLQGDVTVYEARGQYQLIVRALELQGVGALQIAFEQLKQKLQAEGLFAPERKRPLPKYPERMGLVTSPTGAAIQDVLHVVRRRHPALEIILAPCRVQGAGAGREVADAIRLLNEFNVHGSRRDDARSQQLPIASRQSPIDLILVTRGGGSLEDLWAFNEEIVARAVFESQLPVVSAVGHEIDFTICDFVADVRAATPSAGAEIITEGVFSSVQFVSKSRARLRRLGAQRLAGKRELLEHTARRLARAHPSRRINDWMQRLDDLQTSLLRCARLGTQRSHAAWQQVAERLYRLRPAQILRERRALLQQKMERLRERVRHRLRERRNGLAMVDARLRLLGPAQVLARGYSITTDVETGKILRDAAEVEGGQRLKTRLKRGEIFSRAEK